MYINPAISDVVAAQTVISQSKNVTIMHCCDSWDTVRDTVGNTGLEQHMFSDVLLDSARGGQQKDGCYGNYGSDI